MMQENCNLKTQKKTNEFAFYKRIIIDFLDNTVQFKVNPIVLCKEKNT
jgi:hypothetical protein